MDENFKILEPEADPYNKDDLKIITEWVRAKRADDAEIFLDGILHEAWRYKRNSVHDNLGKELLATSSSSPKLSEVRKNLGDIEKAILSAHNKIIEYEDLQLGWVNYLSPIQSDALSLVKKASRMLKAHPLPQPKAKTGKVVYPALRQFVLELIVMYREITGKKGALSTTNIVSDSDFDYAYKGELAEFLSICILPLCQTHNDKHTLLDFASNVRI